MNILAIGAHPDDLEMMCGGTLAKYAAQGHQVCMVHVSAGDVGHMIIPPDELAVIRAREAREAGALIGAEVISLEEKDLFICSDNLETRRKIVDVIRTVRPDMILTHSPRDYMDDHEETSRLVYRATMTATVPYYRTERPSYPKLTPLYYFEPLAGVDSLPEEYVDITDYIDIKMAMLAKHASQHEWLKEHDGMDMPDLARTLSRLRGYQCGTTHAEGFTGCRRFHKLRAVRMLP